METWDQMTRRHKRERREMVEAFAAQRVTQTVAAKHMNTTLTCLNNYIRRNGIFWPVMSQGVRDNPPHSTPAATR